MDKQTYKDMVLKLFCKTARVYTLRFLYPMVKKKNKKGISNVYDVLVSMAFGQIRRVEALDKDDADFPTRAAVVLHYITCSIQRDTAEEVLKICQQKDRLAFMDAEIDKALEESKQIYQSLPKEILTYQQRHFDTMYRLRPILVRDDQRLINHQKIFTFFPLEAKEDRGDYRDCHDNSQGVLTLDDFIPKKFCFGNDSRREGAFYAMGENIKNLNQDGEGDQ